MIPYEEFKDRADRLRERVERACAQAGRDPAAVEIMAVTKTHPAVAASYAARYGLRSVGENRVQEGLEKRPFVPEPLSWELIGHLQSNKASSAVRGFDRIQSVDSEKLLGLLDRAAAQAGKTLPILLQVNAADDPAKFGVDPAGAPRLLESALGRPALKVEGLMTISMLSSDPTDANRAFAALRLLRDRLAAEFRTPLSVLSMGMTDDLEQAVAEGSTLVRVGTALFGPRG